MKRSFLLAGWLLAVFIAFATFGPAADRPKFGYPQVERFAAFFALAVCWAGAYPMRPWLVFAALAAVAILLEAAQTLAPGRDPGLVDTVVKVAGAAAGTGLIAVARRLWRPARNSRGH